MIVRIFRSATPLLAEECALVYSGRMPNDVKIVLNSTPVFSPALSNLILDPINP